MAKHTPELILTGLELDKNSKRPMYWQLYDGLRQNILTGMLRAGQRLPASREFSTMLGVSRSTVLLAMDHLLSEGYIIGKTGSGTFISNELPEKFLYTSSIKNSNESHDLNAELSKRGKQISKIEISTTPMPEAIRAFQPGLPAIREFPHNIWSRIVTRCLRMISTPNLGYGESIGYFPLREAIANHIRVARAVKCEPEQIIIVNGSQQALDLTARILADPEDIAWIEDPGYLGAKAAFSGNGIKTIPVPVDHEGLNVTAGKKAAPKARIAYITPSHQYPLGVTMSLPRRLQILDWANNNNAWILEDDYDSEYRYGGNPLSSLQGLDENNRVIYLGTFSKVMFPALRLGYIVVPPGLVEVFLRAKSMSDRHNAMIEQLALAEFIANGDFARHIRKMRILYHERQQTLIFYAQKHLKGALHLDPSNAGLHSVGWLTNQKNDKLVSEKARELGVIAPAISAYCMAAKVPSGLSLGYAPFTESEIKTGIELLANIL